MVSWALKLTIKAYVEQIVQVFQNLFVTTDFFAVTNKNYVWSFGSWYTSTCDVNFFFYLSINMEYNISLSFEYTNFCLIISKFFQQHAHMTLKFL
jgi:hypothetical protein